MPSPQNRTAIPLRPDSSLMTYQIRYPGSPYDEHPVWDMPPLNSDVIRYDDLSPYEKWHCAVYIHVPTVLKVEDGMQ
jgi:hypothetical protein